MFKVELHLAPKQPINVKNNTAYIFVNKRPSNNDNNKTKSLIVRQNQHVPIIPYIKYMGNQAYTFYFSFERFGTITFWNRFFPCEKSRKQL